MLRDDLLDQLKSAHPDIETIKAYWQKTALAARHDELEKIVNQEDFWRHPKQAMISKELQNVKTLHKQYQHIIESYREYNELIDLFAHDEHELKKIAPDITQLLSDIIALKINLLLNKPEDTSNCFLSINAGAGGTEAQDWAHMILRMYLRFCEREKLNVKTIDYQAGEEAGIKSATLFISGKNAYGMLKSEHGIHRLVRISPFDASKRRHTSFAGIVITPEVPDIEVKIDPNDLRIDTYRASGAGGQHVNKTDSAVRITHIPTNIVVQCQNERSQTQNKETAMKMLTARLAQKLKQEQEEKLKGTIEKKKIEWGSQIRSYVLHPYKMVKDHRTNHESPQPEVVLDGAIVDFIESYLVWSST